MPIPGGTKNLLGKSKKRSSVTTKEDDEEYLANVHNDSHRNRDYV
jgi:hypothetical protein